MSANGAFSTVLSVTPPDSVLRFGEHARIGLTLTGPNGEFEPSCVRGRQWCPWKWNADLAEADWGDTGRLGLWAYWLGSSGTDPSTIVHGDTVRTQWWYDLHYVTSNNFPFYEGYPLGNAGDRTEGLFGYIYDYRSQADELETPVQIDFSVTGVYRDWNPDPEPDTTNTVSASVQVLPPWLEAEFESPDEAPSVSLGAQAPMRAVARDALGPVPLDPERAVWVYLYPIWIHPEDPEPIDWYDGGGGQVLNTRTGASATYGLRVPYKDVRDGNVVYQTPTTADFEYGQARHAEAGRAASGAGQGLERHLTNVRDRMLEEGLDLDRVEAHVAAARSRLERRVLDAAEAERSVRVGSAGATAPEASALVYFEFVGYDMYEYGAVFLTEPPLELVVDRDVLQPGESATVSIEGADDLDPGLQVVVTPDDRATAAGALLLHGEPAPLAIALGDFQGGAVTYKANLFEGGPPAALTDEPPARVASSDDPIEAPAWGSPEHALPTVPILLQASITGNEPLGANLDVVPFGVRFDIAPTTAGPGVDILGGITVTRAVDLSDAAVQTAVGPWLSLDLTPFICAQGVVREDPLAVRLPQFASLPIGRTSDGLFECAKFIEASVSGLVGLHDVEFTYPDEAGEGLPDDGVALQTYGGLATRVDGEWRWATALPGTSIGRPLAGERAFTLQPGNLSEYYCSKPGVVANQTVELMSACEVGNRSTGMPVSYVSEPYGDLGRTRISDLMMVREAQVAYCLDPVTEQWRPEVAVDLPTTYSACPTNALNLVDASRVLTGADDPKISAATADSYLDAIERAADLYGRSRDLSMMTAVPRLANVWVEDATLVHERGHVEWIRDLLLASAYEGLGAYYSRTRPSVYRALLQEGVRDIEPDLFDRGLVAVLDDLALPVEEASGPDAARDALDARVRRYIDRFGAMIDRARIVTGGRSSYHLLQYRLAARELNRIAAVLQDRYDLD